MTTPMPKTKARSLLQTGRRPRDTNTMQDPDEAIHQVPIVRTLVGDRAGATPSEAYQYDLVFECFSKDQEFQRYWKVPKNGWARCSTEESISQKNSYIRVVMDLDKECKLYPTAYTPGFATVPRDISEADLRKASAASGSQQKIPGLPEGYSVALDVYILKDAEILLKHQRAFRGRVDAAYRWLDYIVNPGMRGELSMMEVAPMNNPVVQTCIADGLSAGPSLFKKNGSVKDTFAEGNNKHWTWHSSHLGSGAPAEARFAKGREGYSSSTQPMALANFHEMIQPAAREELPLSCLRACPRGLKQDPELDEVGKKMQDFRKEIHMENALINAFGDHVGLPQRDTGTSWGREEDGGASQRRAQAYSDETKQLDRALEDLWSKTVYDQTSGVVAGETSI